MKPKRTLILAIVLSLAAGALVAAVVANVPAAEAPGGIRSLTAKDPPLKVPESRVGDSVSYATFTRASKDADWASGPGYVFQAKRTDQISDASGARRDVLVLASNNVDSDGTHTPLGVRDPWSYTDPGLLTEYVDRVSRDVVRIDVHSARTASSSDDHFASFNVATTPSLPGLAFQGRTLAPKQDVSGLARVLPDPKAALRVSGGWNGEGSALWAVTFDGESGRPWTDEQVSSEVRLAARLDGRLAYGVVTDISATVHDLYDWTSGKYIRAEYALHRTTWFAAGVPYPVLDEVDGSIMYPNGTQVQLPSSLWSLIQYAPGSIPAPWASTAAVGPVASAPPGSASSGGVPADGSDPGIPYPLGLAQQDVESDLRLSKFRAWRVLNPGALLVSAFLSPGETSSEASPSHRWRLVFAVPDGSGYEVHAERAGQTTLVEDLGERKVPAFDPSKLPARPMSLTTAHGWWKQQAPEGFRDRAPTFVLWGFNLGVDQGLTSRLPGCGRGIVILPGDVEELHQLQYGFTNAGVCATDGMVSTQAAIVLDTASGRWLGSYSFRRDLADQPLSGPQSASLPGLEAPAGGWKPPAVGAAALASSSFLALFLAVYFWPALKYAAAQGLLVIPGYSRLARSQLLDHRVRDDLVETIKQNPGIHATQLGRDLRIGWGNLVYHLRRLEDNSLVFSAVEGRHRRFFAAGAVPWTERDRLAVLRNERARAFYDLILETPGIQQVELARHFGLPPPNVLRTLRRLEGVGLVERVGDGRAVRYRSARSGYDPAKAVEVV